MDGGRGERGEGERERERESLRRRRRRKRMRRMSGSDPAGSINRVTSLSAYTDL